MYFQPIILVTKQNKSADNLKSYLDKESLRVRPENLVSFSTEKSSIGIRDIAKLSKEISKINDELNVFIIEQSHRLTDEAQNSLLKTLEEPNANSLIILSTDNTDSLKDTIRSRCIEVFYLEESDHPSDELFEKFINSDYLRRKELIDEITKEDNAREFALELILYIMKEAQNSKPEIANKLMQIHKSLKQGSNIKLGLENLSISLI